jgi:hypothetical protein
MADFTGQEITNLEAALLDNYMKSDDYSQKIQERPMLDAMMPKSQTFPGGKESIRGAVKADYTTEFMGYTHDMTVAYANPANLKQFNYEWKELHAGISVTHTELKKAGISVSTDKPGSTETSQHTDAELIQIVNLLDDKNEDMAEGSMRSFNSICWRDGTASPLLFPGITGIITFDPTTGIVAGIDRGGNDWWRNLAYVGANKITSSPANQTLTKKLRSVVRQLRRYGGKPKLILCGSGFLDLLEAEAHEKGVYTQTGFADKSIDVGEPVMVIKGLGSFKYDPTLDDMGLTNFCYFIDQRHLFLKVMEGEDMKQHAPARPAEKYVMYRAVTWTGCMVSRKMNCHAVIEAA